MRPKSTRYLILWRGIDIQVKEVPDYLWEGTTHLELHVIRPKKAPLPITESGYRSHFIDTLELAQADGAVKFVTTWLDTEAKSKAWLEKERRRQQLSLFPD